MRNTKCQHRAKTTKNDKAATIATQTCISKEKFAMESQLAKVHIKDRSDKSFLLPYKQPCSHHLKTLARSP